MQTQSAISPASEPAFAPYRAAMTAMYSCRVCGERAAFYPLADEAGEPLDGPGFCRECVPAQPCDDEPRDEAGEPVALFDHEEQWETYTNYPISGVWLSGPLTQREVAEIAALELRMRNALAMIACETRGEAQYSRLQRQSFWRIVNCCRVRLRSMWEAAEFERLMDAPFEWDD